MKRSAKSASLSERIKKMKKGDGEKIIPAPTVESPKGADVPRTSPAESVSTPLPDITYKRRKLDEGTSFDYQDPEDHDNLSRDPKAYIPGIEEGMEYLPWPRNVNENYRRLLEVYYIGYQHREELWTQLSYLWTEYNSRDRYGVGYHNPDSYNLFIVGKERPRGTHVPGVIRETIPLMMHLRAEVEKETRATYSTPATTHTITDTPPSGSKSPLNAETSAEATSGKDLNLESSQTGEEDKRVDSEPASQPLPEKTITSPVHSPLEGNKEQEENPATNSSIVLPTDLNLQISASTPIQNNRSSESLLNASEQSVGSDLRKALCSVHFLRSVGTEIDVLKVDMGSLAKECHDARDDIDRLSGEVQDLELSIKELPQNKPVSPSISDLFRDQMNREIAAIHSRLVCLEGQKDTEEISYLKRPSSSEFQAQGYQQCIDDMIERNVFPWSLLDDPSFMSKVIDAESLRAKRPSSSNSERWSSW